MTIPEGQLVADPYPNKEPGTQTYYNVVYNEPYINEDTTNNELTTKQDEPISVPNNPHNISDPSPTMADVTKMSFLTLLDNQQM